MLNEDSRYATMFVVTITLAKCLLLKKKEKFITYISKYSTLFCKLTDNCEVRRSSKHTNTLENSLKRGIQNMFSFLFDCDQEIYEPKKSSPNPNLEPATQMTFKLEVLFNLTDITVPLLLKTLCN